MTEDEVARALAGFYTTKPHGTGLGLSVVRRLVADHGGAVHIDTAPQRGTTVIVELPTHPTPIPRSRARQT
jgi:signal transduction histidine kinase